MLFRLLSSGSLPVFPVTFGGKRVFRKNARNYWVMRSLSFTLNGTGKIENPDGDASADEGNKKKACTPGAGEKEKSHPPRDSGLVDKINFYKSMTETVVYPKHRFYFNVEAESISQEIASELPSYRIACEHIRRHASETGNQQEVYYIRLFRRHNHRCWSVLQCMVKFRDEKVLIVGAKYIENAKAA